jgi:UDP-glucose 6-dehydrogenase
MPEFLRERYWDTDCFKRPLVVGSDNSIPQWLQDEEIKTCSTKEAELVKMYSNNFAVMRIAFANVFYDLAENVGADYNKVLDMYLDIQQDQTYMEVPGHDGTRGFGGKCLPKDLDFLIETLDEKGIDQNWFKHIRELNKRWQKKF